MRGLMIYGNRDSDKMLRGCLFTLGVAEGDRFSGFDFESFGSYLIFGVIIC